MLLLPSCGMDEFQPATAHTNAIERIACPNCGTAMRLFGVEGTADPFVDLHSFECPTCGNIEVRLGPAETLQSSDKEVEQLAERMVGNTESKL